MAKNNKLVKSLKGKYNPMNELANSLDIQIEEENVPVLDEKKNIEKDILLSPQELKKINNGGTVKVVQTNSGKQQISILVDTEMIEDIQNLLFVKNANRKEKNKHTFTSITVELLNNYINEHREEIEMVKKFKSKLS